MTLLSAAIPIQPTGLQAGVLAEIQRLCRARGPQPHEYGTLYDYSAHLQEQLRAGVIGKLEIAALRDAFGPAMGAGTVQGRAWLKAHGYAGDYQIIDDIYTQRVSEDPMLRGWDEFFHAGLAPQAVRNRKGYFKQLLSRYVVKHTGPGPLRVLNVASGPCRDVAEYFEQSHSAPVHITCLDQDANAIAHARRLCRPFADSVDFVQGNALKFSSERKYDLIWSAGLFDYFNDEWFVTALKRLARALTPGGSLVVGNFSPSNPQRAYMEVFGEWVLHHRSTEQLLALAERAGLHDAVIGQEPLGINLFIHAHAGAQVA
ncbi:methyltransferase domain-containing protein [Polaromonas sp.]|uniref:methyltransferase domain-containing protein n=1 Tax=Polaromonas sp. TaxID=1869339 RepID=UPI00375316F4